MVSSVFHDTNHLPMLLIELLCIIENDGNQTQINVWYFCLGFKFVAFIISYYLQAPGEQLLGRPAPSPETTETPNLRICPLLQCHMVPLLGQAPIWWILLPPKASNTTKTEVKADTSISIAAEASSSCVASAGKNRLSLMHFSFIDIL